MRSRGKARTLSKITVEPEPGVADTLLTAELDETHTAPTFAELNVRPEIVRALAEMGIERTFAIQELTLPLALAGEDLIGQARTGMGKTFGFGVPLLHRISTGSSGTIALDGTPRALVIVPTRELCVQVTSDLENAAKHVKAADGTPLRVTAIYGGRPYESQIEALRRGVDVVVGTPGRLLDLAEQQHLILGKVQVLVLDEADEMLDLGFLPDIERILNMVPDQRQTMLFSATMPGPIITLARTFLNRPTHIRAEEPHDSAVHDRIEQFVYRAHALDKSELIARILQAETRGATMIFARTKRTAQKVADDLAERGFAVGAVHGDLGQIAREKALKKFREGKIDVLVATDVAARGIDIDDVTHVVNYQCPEDEKTYVHRIGRTGRAGRAGVAITLVDWDELKRWASIDAALDLKIPEPVETYSRSPHLYAELGIPEGITGVLRKRKPERDDDAVVVERESRAPRDRGRRRTRGGRPIDGEAAVIETTGSPVPESDSADEDKPGRRRRRRRRGKGAGDNTAAVTNGNTETAANVEAAQPNPAAEGNSNGNGNTEGGRRRRRNRRGGRGQADTNGTAETRSNETDSARQAEVTATAHPAEVSTVNTPAAPAATEIPAAAADAGTAVSNDAGTAVANSGNASAETDSTTEAPRKRARRTRGSADATNGSAVAVNGTGSSATGEQTALFSHALDTHAPSTTAAAANGSAVTDPTATAAPATGNGPATGDPVATGEAPRKRTRRAKAAEPTGTEAASGTATEATTTEAEAPRKRTRKATAEATSVAADTADTTADLAAPAVAEAPAPRKRARRAAGAADATAVEASTEGVSAADTVDAPKAAPRKRTRSTAVTAEGVNAPAASNEAAAQEAAATEAAPKKRARRTAGTPDPTVVATEDTATVDAPKAAPRKRTRSTAIAAEAVNGAAGSDAAAREQEAVATEAAPKKRARRTAGAPDATAVATEDTATVDAPKAAPRKQTRKAATTAAASEPAVVADAGQEAAPAPRKRTRATKAAAPVTEVTTDATEAPKKRASRAKAAEASTIEVAEAVPAAPKKRTSRSAKAVDTAETVAEKPKKRTRTKATASTDVTADEAVAASA